MDSIPSQLNKIISQREKYYSEIIENLKTKDKPYFFIASCEKEPETRWRSKIGTALEDLGIELEISIKKRRGKTVPIKVREDIVNSHGIVALVTLLDEKLPVWIVFEVGMAFASGNEETSIILVDEEVLKKSKGRKWGEEAKFVHDITKGFTEYIPIDIVKIKSRKHVKETIDEIVKHLRSCELLPS